jgi:hypothetical protein
VFGLSFGGGKGTQVKSATAADTTVEHVYAKQGSRRDTLITLSADWGIHYSRYNEKMDLWYGPRLVNLNKKDTITIKGDFYGGSNLYVNVSPNSKFLVLDDVAAGYVYTGKDTILHYRGFCNIIDITNAVSILKMQSDCSGMWDKENNWINGDKIVFSSREYNVINTIKKSNKKKSSY